jgi:hypothetical protein
VTFGAHRLTLLVLIIAASGAGGCASRFVVPGGTPAPAPDALPIWDALTTACRDVTTMRAELRVSGSVRGQRVPTLTTGMAVDAERIAMVATYNGRPMFNVAGATGAVTLLDHLERRVVEGGAPEVLDSLVGIQAGPDRLLALLTGCISRDPSAQSSSRIADFLRIDLPDSSVYLASSDSAWRLRAATFGDVVAEYRRIEAGWPREIELRRRDDVRLRIRVIEWEHNPTLPAGLFRLSVPPAYVSTPLE